MAYLSCLWNKVIDIYEPAAIHNRIINYGSASTVHSSAEQTSEVTFYRILKLLINQRIWLIDQQSRIMQMTPTVNESESLTAWLSSELIELYCFSCAGQPCAF